MVIPDIFPKDFCTLYPWHPHRTYCSPKGGGDEAALRPPNRPARAVRPLLAPASQLFAFLISEGSTGSRLVSLPESATILVGSKE